MIDLFIKWSGKPFEYGVSDCCQFVGACLEERFGRNPAREFLYLGESGARDLVDSYGGLSNLLTELFGQPHSDGKDGDVALIEDQQIVGYVHRNRIVARTLTDVNDLPLERAREFWRG